MKPGALTAALIAVLLQLHLAEASEFSQPDSAINMAKMDKHANCASIRDSPEMFHIAQYLP